MTQPARAWQARTCAETGFAPLRTRRRRSSSPRRPRRLNHRMAAIIAVRSAGTSIARPRSRSASSKPAAATSATPASGCDTAGTPRGATAIRGRGDQRRIHQGHPGERERGEPKGALSRPRSAQTRPGLPLPLMEADPLLPTFRPADGRRVGMRCACAPGALCIAPITLIMAQRLCAPDRRVSDAGPALGARTVLRKARWSSLP